MADPKGISSVSPAATATQPSIQFDSVMGWCRNQVKREMEREMSQIRAMRKELEVLKEELETEEMMPKFSMREAQDSRKFTRTCLGEFDRARNRESRKQELEL